MDTRYSRIATFLRMIVETIEDGDIDMYAENSQELIDFIIDELQRNY